MKKTILSIAVCVCLLHVTTLIQAQQQPPFWNEIAAFKKQDSAHFPPKQAILFVGSSSFRMWSTVQDDFPGYKIINRGFGGSAFPDVTRYSGDIIFPYQPKQIVIYCGDNDLAASDTVSAGTVFSRFVQLFSIIRKKMPDVHIVFVSIKPSPSRQMLMPKMEKANALIRKFLQDNPRTAFADVYHAMLTPRGEPVKELFLADNLHMNAKGYAIWKKIIQPFLLKP